MVENPGDEARATWVMDVRYTGRRGSPDGRITPPERRDAEEVRRLLRRLYWMAHVMLPHVLAVTLGTALFVAAVADAPGLAGLSP